MFQAVINRQTIELEGTEKELLEGLCCYIEALSKANIDLELIQKVADFAIKEMKNEKLDLETNRVKVIEKNKNFTVHEIHADGLSKEEIKNLIGKILENNGKKE